MHMRATAICNFQISYRPRTAVIYGRCVVVGVVVVVVVVVLKIRPYGGPCHP